MSSTIDPNIIKLTNVRLSFPHLFTAHAMQGGQEAKFSATFILDTVEHAPLIAHIDKQIKRIALDTYKKNVAFKPCLRDGNEKPDMDGYGDGVFFLPAARRTRPAVVDRQMNPLTEEDGMVYAGCYVNASIRLWGQDNKFGKRINAELRAIQFVKDGESFGAAPVKAEEEFEPLGAEDPAFY